MTWTPILLFFGLFIGSIAVNNIPDRILSNTAKNWISGVTIFAMWLCLLYLISQLS